MTDARSQEMRAQMDAMPVNPDGPLHPGNIVSSDPAAPWAVRLPPAITVDDSTPQFTTSSTIGKLAVALAKAQKLIKQPKKEADNPFFKSKYADLHTVWESARNVLADFGVAVIQTPSFSTSEMKGKVIGIITISTTVIHGESGEWMTNVLRGTSENIGPQAIGSAISYFRRYSLQPLLMLTPDDGSDDDAEKAEGRTAPAEDKPTPEQIDGYTLSIKNAPTVEGLKAIYAAIPEAHKRFFNKLVSARKAALEKNVAPKAEQAEDGQGGTA